MRPLIGIVILAKDEAHNLRRSLPVILSQEIGHEYEVVVIDSGSTDGSVELVAGMATDHPNLRLVQIGAHEFHHARTRNRGAELTEARYVVYLGGDAIPTSRAWLRTLAAPVLDAGSVAAAYGRQLPRPNAGIASLCRMTYNYPDSSRVKDASASISPKERYFFSSVNCIVDRARAPDPFFDASIPVNEDVTLSRRLIEGGHAIAYVAEAAVEHSHDYSWWQIVQRYFDNAVTYQRIGIFGAGGERLGDDGARYLRIAMHQLRGRPYADLVRFAAFFACSVVGVQLGMRYRHLPAWLQRRLSAYGTAA
jgi:rhamnosyltransferase